MGFFSKTCAKTHLPIVHNMRGYPELCNVVALLKDGGKVEGEYDGYGNVGGIDVAGDWDSVKLILSRSYDNEGYDEVGESGREDAQGHFMSDKFLDHCIKVGSFKSRKDYDKSFKKLADW
jgi:hypothetical protein